MDYKDGLIDEENLGHYCGGMDAGGYVFSIGELLGRFGLNG